MTSQIFWEGSKNVSQLQVRLKSVTMGSEIVKYYATSFMDDPKIRAFFDFSSIWFFSQQSNDDVVIEDVASLSSRLRTNEEETRT